MIFREIYSKKISPPSMNQFVVSRNFSDFYRESKYIEWTISRKITNAQCGNFRIFLSFRDFTWNQIENLQVLKSSFCHFRAPRFVHLVNFSFQKVQKFIQKSKLRASKCQNCGFWYTLNSPTLISRKNWVTEKFCKFQIPHCEDT